MAITIIKDYHRFNRRLLLDDQEYIAGQGSTLSADNGIVVTEANQFVLSSLMQTSSMADAILSVWAYPGYDASIRLRVGADAAVSDWSISIDSTDTTNEPLVFTNKAILPGTSLDVLKIYNDGTLLFANGETIDNIVDGTVRVTSSATKFGTNGYLTITDNSIENMSGGLLLDINGNTGIDTEGAFQVDATGYAEINAGTNAEINAVTTTDLTGPDGVTLTTDENEKISMWAHVTAPMCIFQNISNTSSLFRMNERGGVTADDYFQITCADDGATRIITVDDASRNAHIEIIPDGAFDVSTVASGGLIKFEGGRDSEYISDRGMLIKSNTDHVNLYPGPTAGVSSERPLYIKEVAVPAYDREGYGQLWVKDNAPNDLYYTDDQGQDIQITDDGSLGAASGNTTYISRLHRWGASADNKYYGGYQGGYSRTAELYGLTSEIDASMYGWPAVKYSDFMAPAPGTIVNFNGVAQQDTASSDVALSLFKVTITDDDSITGGQVVDFIGKIQWAANVDTTSIHALHTHGGLDPTAAHFNAGDILVVGFSRESGSDAVYYWIRYTVEFQYD